MLTEEFKIEGLDCAEEVALLNKVLQKAEGIKDLEYNLLQSKITVTYDESKMNIDKILSLVDSSGLKGIRWQERLKLERESFYKKHGRLLFTLLSGVFLLSGLIAEYVITLPLQMVHFFYLIAIFFGVWLVLPKAYISLKRISPDINLLMIIAIIGALFIHQWFEAASVAFLFSLALLLEQWSVRRARSAISALMDLAPKRARVINLATGSFEEKNVEDVNVGEIILVRPGEKVSLDGVVIKGSSSLNQSPITGESIPVHKEVGDEVFAGTLNEEGALECRVTKKADDTTLAHIIRLIEQARAKHSESEQWVERFARVYTPFMLLFSVMVILIPPLVFGADWLTWVYRGLVLLVIACPCSLVISTPVSIVSGLTAAARNGVLIKGGVFLEEISNLKAFALDKTGTLTYGHPEVQKIVPLNGHTIEELMRLAVAIEQSSEHPIARAILRKAKEMGITAERATNFQIVKGKGAVAMYQGRLFWIGSHRLMHEMEQETPQIHEHALLLEDAGHTVIAIGTDDHVCGLISIADEPRAHVRETLEALKREGVQEIVMLTGDNEPTARALAEYAGISHYKAELLPEEKVEAVRELMDTWEKVGMIGDGINDAPAMATATIGFAMGAMGTDVAIETADVTLMSDDLSKLPWLYRYSARVVRIIKQNITFSLSVKALFVALAIFNFATLWMAIAADTGATLLVIFNALRLLRNKRASYSPSPVLP